MKYNQSYFHTLLLHKKSIDFEHYKNVTEKDLLIQFLNHEDIADYGDVEWWWIGEELYGEEKYDGLDFYIEYNGELERFLKKIVSRDKQIRILSYLRDNCRKELFAGSCNIHTIENFENECARLICQSLKDSERDEFHGMFATMPHPNLHNIALGGQKLPELTETETIIARYLPNYSHDIGLFPPNVIIRVAREFVDRFKAQADQFLTTKLDMHKPCMSLQQYCEPIRNRLIEYTDRYLIFEKEPIYQVVWVMGVLLRLPQKSNWWIDKFSESIINYLNCTKEFAGTKDLMDSAINAIRLLTEQELPFEDIERVTDNGSKKRVTNLLPQKKISEKFQKTVENPTEKTVIYAQQVNIDKNHAQIISIENSNVTKHS